MSATGAGTPGPGAPSPGTSGGTAPDDSLPPGLTPRAVERIFDGLLTVHRPLVVANVRFLRRRMPRANPGRLIRVLEAQFLAGAATGGAGLGAAAAVPGVGTGVGVALAGVGTVGFLEASAVYAQSVAHVHGITIEDPDRARALVMTLMLGPAGIQVVQQFAGRATGEGPRQNVFWGEIITTQLPKVVVGQLVDHLKGVALRRIAADQAASAAARVLPLGIGALIGGAGNGFLAHRVVRASRLAFGPAPHGFAEPLPERVAPEPREPRPDRKERRLLASERRDERARERAERRWIVPEP